MAILLISIFLILFGGIGGFGLYAGIVDFFVVGVVGFLATVVHVVINGYRVCDSVSFMAMIGAILYAAYVATQLYF